MEGKFLNSTDDNIDVKSLKQQVDNLIKLVDINNIINSTLDIRKLLTLIMEIIKDIMCTEASTLLLYEEKTRDLVFKVALGEASEELTEKYRVRIGQGIAGWVAETRKSLYVNDVYDDRRFDPDYDKQTGFNTRSIICTPLLFKGKLIGVIQAINPLEKNEFNDMDMELFNIFATQAAIAVQNAIFFHSAIEEERIASELSSAKSIQESLIPDFDEKMKGIHITGKSYSAREVGGEFHSLFRFNDDMYGIGLGDIHEKGIPGGLHASMMSGSLKTLAVVKGEKPGEVMKLMGKTLSWAFQSIDKVSLFYGVINVPARELQFVNAGIAYPILVRDGVSRYLKLGSRSLSEDMSDLKKVIVRLRQGDLFVILTNGLLNVRSRSGMSLGLKRVMKVLERKFDDPAHLIDSLISYAEDFSGGLGKREDISIIVFKVE